MTATPELTAYTNGPASGGKPKQLVILLHGLGANGQDLLGLAPFFGALLPDAVFVSPDAPFPCDMAPYGFQWFSLQDRRYESMIAGAQRTAPILDHFIASQMEKYGVPADKTALVGFSQGTMMSLYVGPRYPEKLAGILGYSGALVWEPDTDIAQLQKLPIHLIHGDADQVVDPIAWHEARRVLGTSGFTVTGELTPGLAHNIDELGLESGGEFLASILK
jgi:phospholipase/carboxylesterase